MIVAIILGGTSLAGGEGRLTGTLIGALIVGFLGNGLNLAGVEPFWQYVAQGIVLVFAVRLRRPVHAGGSAALVPAPPWHYVGDFLVIDFHAEPEAATSLLPDGLTPHPDAGRCAAVFVDWQSFSEGGDELTDPVRSQYASSTS